MKRLSAAILVVSFAVLAPSLADNKPDIAGTWTYAPNPGNPPRSHAGNVVIIGQQEQTWIVRYGWTADNPFKSLECPDGGACRVDYPALRLDKPMQCTLYWEEAALVTDCQWEIPNSTKVSTEKLVHTLQSDGSLTVERRLSDAVSGSKYTYKKLN
jgi:hypothetical protein